MENEMELKLQEPQLEGLLTPLAGFQTFLCLYGADAETVCRKGWAAHRAPVIRTPEWTVERGQRSVAAPCTVQMSTRPALRP